MKKILSLFSAFLLICSLVSAAETFEVESLETGTPWTSLKANDDSQNFQFVIVSDRTGGLRKGVFDQAIDKINLLQPEFVVSIGDLIQGYTKDEAVLKKQVDEVEGMIARLEMPFFYLPGNHDITNDFLEQAWLARYGKTYYHFLYKQVLFVCLNTEESPQGGEDGRLSPAQVEYVLKVLTDNQDVRWTFVFMHKPIFDVNQYGGHSDWGQIETALQDRQYTVFAGHVHEYARAEKDGHDYIKLSTTGGKNLLRGPAFGEFDHIVWITMTATEPRIVNLMLDGIADKNIRTAKEANFMDSLIDGSIVEIDPLYVTAHLTPAHQQTELRLTNSSDQSLQISGSFTFEEPVEVTPAEFDFEVPANTTKKIPITVTAHNPISKNGEDTSPVSFTFNPENPVGLTDKAPLLVGINWEIAYSVAEGEKPHTFTGKRRLGITQELSCPFRKRGTIVVDGKLDDWGELPYTLEQPWQVSPKQLYPEDEPKTYGGAEDFHGSFATAFDEEYLYIAIEVIDDHHYVDSTRMGHWQDGVEIWLDARPDPSRTQPNSKHNCAWAVGFFANPPAELGIKEIPRTYYPLPPLPDGTKIVIARTPTGHVTEVAIPTAYLDEKQDQPWRAFNLNIAINDFDGARNGLHLDWQPNWNGEKAFAGEGYFVRP